MQYAEKRLFVQKFWFSIKLNFLEKRCRCRIPAKHCAEAAPALMFWNQLRRLRLQHGGATTSAAAAAASVSGMGAADGAVRFKLCAAFPRVCLFFALLATCTLLQACVEEGYVERLCLFGECDGNTTNDVAATLTERQAEHLRNARSALRVHAAEPFSFAKKQRPAANAIDAAPPPPPRNGATALGSGHPFVSHDLRAPPPPLPPPRALRTAVCITGSVRTLPSPLVYASIKTNFLDQLGGAVDTFVVAELRDAHKVGLITPLRITRAEMTWIQKLYNVKSFE